MTFLTSHLPFPSDPAGSSSAAAQASLPPAGTHLLITDTLKSPAHFAVYHAVAAALVQKRKVIWVDFRGEGRASLETVLKKLGTSLPSLSSSVFMHLQPTSLPEGIAGSQYCPSLLDENDGLNLKASYDAIASAIPLPSESGATASSDPSSPVLILDGLAELLWSGFSPSEVGRLVRACFSLVRRSQGALVTIMHADHLPLTSASPVTEAGPAGELLERLLRLGHGVWWRVAGLESGRSGDVHGEISVHPVSPPPIATGEWQDVPRSNPLQYRLEERGIKVFPKGTGRGFL